uniref:Uncharacterized protein n=1 Tax=Burkholderia phage vB_BgluM-SURPRISE13 TaxID=3159457 RepID=A0AAU7PFA5_9VIRU
MSFGSSTLLADSFKAVEIKALKGLKSNEAEDVSGRTSAEIERVIYVRVKDFGWLERATAAERQEQWSIKIPKTEANAGAGSIRVRKSINLREPGAAVSYVLTTKLEIGNRGSCAETPEQSSLDQFNVFKYLADKGMLKDRYYFNIEASDLQWEVDCFPKPGEMYHDWVKIDLESWPRGKELPSLPMEFTELLDGSEGLQSPESEQKIAQLYETMFLTKNTNQPLSDYGNTDPAPAAEGATNEDGEPQENDNPDANGDAAAAGGDDQSGGGDDTSNPPTDDSSNNTNDDDTGGGDDDENNEDDDTKDDVQKEVKNDTDDLAKATTESFKSNEAFSSMGQVLVPLIPVLGPLVTAIYGHRGMDMTAQHTKKTVSHIDGTGTKTSRNTDTGSYTLTDMTDAKDYIGLIEKAVHEAMNQKKEIDRIDMTLWPQKDGRFGIINIKTDRNGETRIFTENNPGQLKWFSMSLAGKRVIRLKDGDIDSFRFNGRTISCPFQGETVEFDVGQLRSFKYQTKDGNNGFDIVEYNFDA